MDFLWVLALVSLFIIVVFLGFLVLGMLRVQGHLLWRLEQVETVTPSRMSRGGIRPGTKAPVFRLPDTSGVEFTAPIEDQKTLLVFVQPGCGPCTSIVPELNRLHKLGELKIVAVSNSDLAGAKKWRDESAAQFPLLIQTTKHSISRQYQAVATPFAFLIGQDGLVVSKGLVTRILHIQYVLEGSSAGPREEEADIETAENRNLVSQT